MVKHFPGGGSGEGGRDAHYGYGKYAVYPGKNFEEHLKPFTEGAFSLDGKTKKASALMPYYTISSDIGKTEEEFAGKCWGVEHLTDTERHLKALEAGVDQFGGNNDVAPVMEAYEMACGKYGKDAAEARFRRSAYRLLLNIFRTGLFENPYLNLETSLQTVGCKEFEKKGYQSQLKSITMLKNKKKCFR